jgi:predicted CDP-diglyceride synthetase/phosphatidate cytidylyltransferase
MMPAILVAGLMPVRRDRRLRPDLSKRRVHHDDSRRGDHRTLFDIDLHAAQYVRRLGTRYGLYTIMIPVIVAFIPARIAIAGDPKRFLERVAKSRRAVICVYCLSTPRRFSTCN